MVCRDISKEFVKYIYTYTLENRNTITSPTSPPPEYFFHSATYNPFKTFLKLILIIERKSQKR